MAKVKFPLLSGDVSGDFGKMVIFTRGGKVRKYFRPRNPRSAAQLAQRERFKEFSMAGLTKEQADLLYAVIAHTHPELYAALGHVHDHGSLTGLGDDDHMQYLTQGRGDVRYLQSVPQQDHGGLAGLGDDDHTQYLTQGRGDARYSQLGHTHKQITLLGGHAAGQTLAAGATGTLALFATGFLTTGGNVPVPLAGTLKNFYVRIPGAQPASGSLVFTVYKNNSATSMLATCAAGGTGITISDTTHTVTVAAGDLVYVSVKNNATGISAQVGVFDLAFELDTGT
jgi:hypothetical protein